MSTVTVPGAGGYLDGCFTQAGDLGHSVATAIRDSWNRHLAELEAAEEKARLAWEEAKGHTSSARQMLVEFHTTSLSQVSVSGAKSSS